MTDLNSIILETAAIRQSPAKLEKLLIKEIEVKTEKFERDFSFELVFDCSCLRFRFAVKYKRTVLRKFIEN